MFEAICNFLDLWLKIKCKSCDTIHRIKDLELIDIEHMNDSYQLEFYECPKCHASILYIEEE